MPTKIKNLTVEREINMKIIKFEAENIKRLKAIEINPDKNLVEISGKNGQGKTSVLDCILFALGGKKYIPDSAVRNGQKKGNIKIQFDGFTVERTITESGNYLKLTSTSGKEAKKAQTKLDGLLGGLTFDPIHFINLKPPQQFLELLDLLGVEQEFKDLEAKSGAAYDERKIANANVKRLAIKAGDLPEKVEPVDVSELVGKANSLKGIKRDIEVGNNLKAAKLSELKEMEADLVMLENRIEDLKQEDLSAGIFEFEDRLNGIEGMIANATETNRQANEYIKSKALHDELEEAQDEQAGKEKVLAGIKERMKELFTAGNLPVSGLTVKDGGILLNDVPLEEVSQSEKIRTSCLIAMAKNPNLKIMRVKDASLLDEDTLETLKKEVVENDYQLWFETIRQSDENAIIIEEGEIKK